MKDLSAISHRVDIAEVEVSWRWGGRTELWWHHFRRKRHQPTLTAVLISHLLHRRSNEQIHPLFLLFPQLRTWQQTWGHLNQVHILRQRKGLCTCCNTLCTIKHKGMTWTLSFIPWNLLSRLDTSSTASFTAFTGSVTICWMSENNKSR